MKVIRLTVTIVALCLGTGAMAQDAGKDAGIAPQPLDKALEEFADRSGLQVIYLAELAEGKQTPGAKPNLSDIETLDQLLASTGLEYEFLNDKTVMVQAVAEEQVGGDSDPGNGRTAGKTQKPVIMAQAVEQGQTSGGTETDNDNDEERRPLEEIIVTGTNIRGIAPESSPVRTFTREDIQISGAGTVQDFIQTLTANFGGGSNAEFSNGLPNDANVIFNAGDSGSFGSSVNLHGLGSGSTLVLLNGHRIAPSSGIGDFVDISMIPASALERVEILTDGASSIYGGDAVAGVVNFILRDDFDGVETSLRYGTVTEGDLNQYRANFTAGEDWDTGNALVVYEYFNQDDLSVADKSFSQGAPLPNDLLPGQERHSVLAAASRQLTPRLQLFGDLVFSSRQTEQDTTTIDGTMIRSAPSTHNLNISGGGSWKIIDTWFVDVSGTYSDLHIDADRTRDMAPSERDIDSDILALDFKVSGSAIDLPGGETRLAIGGHYREEKFSNIDVLSGIANRVANRDVIALFGEVLIPVFGSSNSTPGLERLEISVSGRFEDYSDFGSTATPKVGILWSPSKPLKIRASYSTSFNPPPLGLVGAADRVGLVYSTSLINSIFGFTPGDPSIADVVALNTNGTAEELNAEESRAFTVGIDFSEHWGRHYLGFSTTYFDIEFRDRIGRPPVPQNRNPFDAPNIAFSSPELFPEGTVLFNPSADQITEFLDSLNFPLLSFPVGLDPFNAVIINRAGITSNLSRSVVRGIDFDLVYGFDSDVGNFTLGLDGTFLRDFQQRGSVATPLVEILNTQFNPVDLKLRGRAGLDRNGFSGTVFVNYTDGYRVDNTIDAPPIDSWTTVDLSLSYDTKDNWGSSIFDNTVLRLSALNLLDTDPPSAPSNTNLIIFGYDPTNASPLGRFIAVEVTKRF